MRNTFYMLRHGETLFTREKTPHEWSLSGKGEKQVKEVTESGCFDDIDEIVTSLELKAIQTALPIGKRLQKEITINAGLNEHDRRNSGFLEQNEFDETIRFAFTNLEQSRRRWETAKDALERFKQAIDEIDMKHEEKKILVVSHGTVLSMYFAERLGLLDNLYDRWKCIDHCAWGVVEDGKVIRDII